MFHFILRGDPEKWDEASQITGILKINVLDFLAFGPQQPMEK